MSKAPPARRANPPVRDETTIVSPDSGLTTTFVNPAVVAPSQAAATAGLHPQLRAQIDESALSLTNAPSSWRTLLARVSTYYQQMDDERRGIVRSMQLMSDEAQSITRELEEQNSGHLRLILDHIQDVVITVSATGAIESFNPTGERVFGYSAAEVLGRRLELLVPELMDATPAERVLRRLAATSEARAAAVALRETLGRRKDGSTLPVEIAVSSARQGRREVFVVCLRDATARQASEQAMRESEARYRALVDHAPEAIVVYDVDEGRFVDVNDHAVRLFKMPREELLKVSPTIMSPPEQPGGRVSHEAIRDHLERASDGEAQTFEWVFRDAFGADVPCEARLARLPSSGRRLLRGSITDITERKRAEAIASGEREVLSHLAANESLPQVLESITRLVESVCPDHRCSVSMLAEDGKTFEALIAPRVPQRLRTALERSAVDIRSGSCAAAVYLGRPVVVADVSQDPFWQAKRAAVMEAGFRATWAVPIKGSTGRIVAALGVYRTERGVPSEREMQWSGRAAQLAGIAIERCHAEEALRTSESKFRRLYETVMEGVFQTSAEGRLLSANRALVQMLGYTSAEELLALPSVSAIYWDPADRLAFVAAIQSEGEVRARELRMRRRDGQLAWALMSARAIRDASGQLTGFEGTLADITERKRVEQTMFAERERAFVTLQSIGDAVISTDARGAIEYVNPVAERLTGWRADECRGWAVERVLALIDDASRASLPNPVACCLQTGEPVAPSDRSLLINRAGDEIAIQDSASPIRDRQGNVIGAVVVFHDVTRERRLKRALSYQATHDVLTGLINRREFDNRLQAAVAAAKRGDSRYALLYVDLDQFKIVNDTCGHPAGDRLIREITSLLQARVRATDTIARLGGDEFGVLLKDCSLEQAAAIADSVRQAIHDHRFVWGARTMSVGASIGLVEITSETDSVAAVMSAADIACYAAKDDGRNRVSVYDSGSISGRHREMYWVARVTQAVEEDRLELHFQPIVSLPRRDVPATFYELTVRLVDTDGTLVMPNEFIPAAERYNVMPTIDRWVVERATTLIARRIATGASVPLLALNLSGTTLNDQGFLDFVLARIADPRVARGLCFEITETAAVANLSNAVYFMRELKARGCRFSLDDFGSGLSSFTYLKNLPVDFLKIDGQFVANVAHDPVDRSMVEAITQVGRTLGITTIAERVETQDVLDELGRIGVDCVQGFLLAKPRPLSEFPAD